MPCDTRLKRIQGRQQTISERKGEIIKAMEKLSKALVSGSVKVKIGPQGAIAFQGWTEVERDGVTDACAYRRIMATGSAQAKMAITKAEQLAGRRVNAQAVAQGHHSHDGGHTWHHGH